MATAAKILRQWWDNKRPYHADHAMRRARFHLSKPFSSLRKTPEIKGRIVCHIVDFENDPSLAGQLNYLAERDVKTFRIYTNRQTEVAEIVSQAQSPLSHCAVAVVPWKSANAVWKQIDLYNWSQFHDKWSLVLRAGEFLLFPHFESRSFPDLCQFMADEHRRGLFTISLDVYGEGKDGVPLTHGEPGWRFDLCGYEFKYSSRWNSDRWQGGMLQRFPEASRGFHRPHLTRVPLLKVSKKSMPARNLIFAYPPLINSASSHAHLSLTGCIASAAAFRHWCWVQGRVSNAAAYEKLLSAPHVRLNWQSEDLIKHGFMNPGQWL